MVWIFAQRLAGHSTAHIARRLNHPAVPGPSGADPARNRHRTDHGWSLRTVTEILRTRATPGIRCGTVPAVTAPDAPRPGDGPTTRNDRHEWAVSIRVVHEPLVFGQDFLTVQTVRAERRIADGGGHRYRLSGKLHCGLCGRRMDSPRVHDRPAYRFRYGHTSARIRAVDAPDNLYLREDHLLARIAGYLIGAGIATDPSPEETARLVGELDLAFRCDTNSITPLTPHAAASRTKGTSGPVTGPTALWRQVHLSRALISHYRRRGDPLP